jgi:hypothetical protein
MRRTGQAWKSVAARKEFARGLAVRKGWQKPAKANVGVAAPVWGGDLIDVRTPRGWGATQGVRAWALARVVRAQHIYHRWHRLPQRRKKQSQAVGYDAILL